MTVTKKVTKVKWAVILLGVLFLAFYVFARPHTATNALQGVFLLVCFAAAGALMYRAVRSRSR